MVVGTGDNFKLSAPEKMKSQSCTQYQQVIHNSFAANQQRCARRITSGRTEQTYSTSSAVESRPSEKRTSELAASFLPVAKTTWLGSSDPAEHAETLDAQMPSISNPSIKAMPSHQLTVKDTVLASDRLLGVIRSHPGMPATQEVSLSSRGLSPDLEKIGGLRNFSTATTKPIIDERFSVPARRSFSWPPPNKIGSG